MTPLEGGRQVPVVGRGVRGVDVHGPLPLPAPEEDKGDCEHLSDRMTCPRVPFSSTHLKNLSQSGARGMGPRTRNKKAICKPPRGTDPSSAKHSNAHPLTLSSSCALRSRVFLHFKYLGGRGALLPELRSVRGKSVLDELLVCHQCHTGSECIDPEQAAAAKGLLLTIHQR